MLKYVICAIAAMWAGNRHLKYAHGKVVVQPGMGVFFVHLGFHAEHVRVRLEERHKHHPHGCGQLEDFVKVERVTETGFEVAYKTSKIGVIRWRARRS